MTTDMASVAYEDDDITEEDVQATSNLFRFVLAHPDAYQEFREEIGIPLPKKFNRTLLETLLGEVQKMMPQSTPPKEYDTSQLASLGEGTDTRLAHINPLEDKILRSYGGAGSINPRTGLPQYGLFKKIRKVIKKIIRSPIGKIALSAAAISFAPYLAPTISGFTGMGAAASSALAGAGMGALGSLASGGKPLTGALIGGFGGYLNAPSNLQGMSQGMLSAGSTAPEGWLSMVDPSLLSGADVASTGMMGGLSYAAPSGLSSYTLASLSNPSSAPTLMQKLFDSPNLTKAFAQGVGGLVSYFGSQSALDDAMKLAEGLQQGAQYNPYGISGPGGMMSASGNLINVALSPQQQAMYDQNKALADQRFKELSNFNMNDYVDQYVDWARSIAAPYEARKFEQLNSMLLNTGMLGGAAGARQIGEYQQKANEADLQRMIAGETLGMNRYNALGNLWNTANSNIGNILQMPYNSAALGLNAGQARSSASAQAGQYPWSVGTEQAAATSGFWNQMGNSLANSLTSAFQNTWGNGSSNQYSTPSYFYTSPYA